MPGFVDVHTHLEYSVFRGVVDDLPYTRWKMEVQRLEDLLTEDDWRDSAVLGSAEAIRSGITTIADVTHSGASLEAADSGGLRAVIYREVSSMDAGKAEAEVAAALDDMRAWEAQSDGARISIGIAPHGPYTCHPRLFQAVAEAVGTSDTHVSLHLAGSRDEYDFVKYGSSPLGQDFRTQSGWGDEAWMPTGVSPVRYVYQWGCLIFPTCSRSTVSTWTPRTSRCSSAPMWRSRTVRAVMQTRYGDRATRRVPQAGLARRHRHRFAGVEQHNGRLR